MVIPLLGAASTCILFLADAFLAFTGWRLLAAKDPHARVRANRMCVFAQRRELPFALVAMASAVFLLVQSEAGHSRAACLAGCAVMALGGHFLVYVKTACIIESLRSVPVGSLDWYRRGGRVEAAMVTRASLQAAAFICIVAAAMT